MSVAGAFIVPHPPIIFQEIGRGNEQRIQRTIDAYRKVSGEAAAMLPETVVILSPHSVMYRDYFHISPGAGACGDFRQFGERELSLRADYDEEFVRELERLARDEELPAGTRGEGDAQLDHGTMIPLRFLQEQMTNFKIVRIGLSGLPLRMHFRLGKCIARAAQNLGRRIVVIASGDLSHCLMDTGPYGYTKEGPEYDQRVTDVMARGSLGELFDFTEEFCERAGECGHRSFCIMAGCLAGKPLKSELLSYEGPFGVGYGVASFQDAYVALARQSLEYYVNSGEMLPLPEGLPEEMLSRRAGVFVSLKKDGDLRGCIGTISPCQKNIAMEIIENAVSAGVYDPRFPPVKRSELSQLICSVDVLSEPEPIVSADELDVKRYGVIVSKGRRRGLLLPNLEGVDTVEQQISIALQKAGIYDDVYPFLQNGGGRFGEPLPFQMERFEVVRHY